MSQSHDKGPELRASVPDVRPELSSPAPSGGSSRDQAAFYSPPPSAAVEASGNRTAWLIAAGAAAATILAVVGGIAFATRDVAAPPASMPAAQSVPAASQKEFLVSTADRDDNAMDQVRAMVAAAMRGQAVVRATQIDLRAENAPVLERLSDAAPQIASDLQTGRRRLYRVYLLDFLDQDGDQVELFLDGISFGNINLKNEGTSVLLPVASDTPLQVKLVATGDGGGGVTVAFISSLGEARTSVMQVGQFEQWQVVVQ